MRIELADLCKKFDGTSVLKGLDFDDDVTTLAIIGPSGGGKSTLLRILGGLTAPTSGAVRVDGETVSYDEATLPAYRAKLGFVFQQGGLFQHLSAVENIAMPLREVHGVEASVAEQTARELLDRFGLADDAEKRPAQLSGGQQQRVAIARAVAGRPRLLLLDEPTSALDPAYTNDVLDMIDDLRGDGMRFVIVTHEMGFAREVANRVLFMDQGKILEEAPPEEFFAHPKNERTKEFLSKVL